MIAIFALIFLFLGMLIIWKVFDNKASELKFKYQMFALRDKLRMYAITGKIDKNSWIFFYFDHSISKAINHSYYLSLFYLLILSKKHKNDIVLQQLNKNIKGELKKNKYLAGINKEMDGIVMEYIKTQHYISLTFIIKPVISIFKGPKMASTGLIKLIKRIREKFKRSIKNTIITPEFSESYFCEIDEDHFKGLEIKHGKIHPAIC